MLMLMRKASRHILPVALGFPVKVLIIYVNIFHIPPDLTVAT